ncbi:SlyX family protein [Geobacter pelophilus]|uniref:SlyX family protein n=1 Tax=Geoanaerobacter pelophilus TaxID=60036 RepID=A0AAW4L1V6_9BACT|nr:SlyX family protein [Geoanaerobacter pelophilus]MBT0665059.1 SlyX family protein [Geoanaerobacter pelophilus]
MEERLIEMETRYMHQEQVITDLSEMVYRQELAIERLERDVRQLKEQLSIALPSLTRSPEDEEPPPHY